MYIQTERAILGVLHEEEPTSAAEKKESSEVMVVVSSSPCLWELSIRGRIRVPSLSDTPQHKPSKSIMRNNNSYCQC